MRLGKRSPLTVTMVSIGRDLSRLYISGRLPVKLEQVEAVLNVLESTR